MSAADQAEPVLQRLEALMARGQALQERARQVEDNIRTLLPDLRTDLATATVDEQGVLTSLTFTDAARDATPEQVEDAVNLAVAAAAGPPALLSATTAAAVLAAVRDGGLPSPTVHEEHDGAVRIDALLGRPGRVRLRAEYVERTSLTILAEVVVAAHAAAARASAPTPAPAGPAAPQEDDRV